MPRRFKKIDKVFEKMLGKTEIDSISSNDTNDNDNDNIYLDKDTELNKYKHKSTFISERIYNILSYSQNIFRFIFGISGIYLGWICLHYFASHLYVKLCVPSTVMGFLL